LPPSSLLSSIMAISKTFLLAFLLPVLLSIAAYSLHFHTTPVFETAVLQRIAQQARLKFPPDQSIKTLNDTVQFISAELKQAYPKHIHPNNQWITNLAGGFKTAMLILHASCTEYVMIWGTQVDTTGHSGRNFAEFHDFLIAGEGTVSRADVRRFIDARNVEPFPCAVSRSC
jgi:hypothetical protein